MKRLRAAVLAFVIFVPVVVTGPAAHAAGGSISGVVTEDVTGFPLLDVNVLVYDADETLVRSVQTDEAGSYTVADLVDAHYRLKFSHTGHIEEWYVDQFDFANADEVLIVASGAETADVSLARSNTVTGTVVSDDTGQPIESVTVVAFDSMQMELGSTQTNALGQYVLSVWSEQDLRIQYRSEIYADEWFDDKPDSFSADHFAVPEGGQVIADASLATGAVISGLVTEDGTSNPIEGAWVSLWGADQMTVDTAWTDTVGAYSFTGLAAGTYRVSVMSTYHLDEWFEDVMDYEAATQISVSAGSAEVADMSMELEATISGTVTEFGSGTGIENASVTAYDASYNWVGSASTGIGGSYEVVGLPAGEYRLYFESWEYPNEWYDDKPDFSAADAVVVGEGGTEVANAELALPGSVSGVVTDSVSGLGVANINVEVHDASNNWAGSSSTDEAGAFNVGGLAAGSYRVWLSSQSHIDVWYDSASSFESAQEVLVESGVDTPISVSLSTGGVVSGTVTSAANGDPVQWMSVAVLDTVMGSQVGNGSTDELGKYSIGGLDDGSYKVQFYGVWGQFSEEWFDDALDYESAIVITINGGSSHVADAQLATPGSVSGVVTDSVSGLGIANVSVEVHDASNNWAGSSSTDESGSFEVEGLDAGSYRVWLWSQSHIDAWYGGASSFQSAQEVLVESGVDTPISVSLSTGGAVSGTVTSAANGDPVQGMWVSVLDASSWEQVGGGSTDDLGKYSVDGLGDGSYKVRFSGVWGQFSEQWFDDASDYESATVVTISGGSSHVADAQLATPGSLTATVTDVATGEPVPFVQIVVYDETNNNTYGQGDHWTDASGSVYLEHIPEGFYRVQATSQTYLDEWYQDASGFDTADPVQIIGGDTTTIALQLSSGGTIDGTITEEGTGTPIEGVDIQVWPADGGTSWMWKSGYTDVNGEYSVSGLPPGDYKVRFMSPTSHEAWFDGKGDWSTADLVAVADGGTTTVNTQLPAPGGIAGTVTEDGSGTVLPDVSVYAYDDSNMWVGGTVSGHDGTYSLSNLGAGHYRIQLWSATHANEWYDDALAFSTAASIEVDPGLVTTVDIGLSEGATIRGTVTDQSTGLPIEGVSVSGTSDPFFGDAWDETGPDGRYEITGLIAADYRVSFYESGYVSEWHLNAANAASATPIALVGEETVVIDAALSTGGTVTGTVTDDVSGEGIRSVYVSVSSVDGSNFLEVQTDANGVYTITGVRGGEYRVRFLPEHMGGVRSHVAEWYEDQPSEQSADFVTVEEGAITVVNAGLAVPGSISGTITDGGGDPVPFAMMRAYDAARQSAGETVWTDSQGNYTIVDLDPGSHAVRAFVDGSPEAWFLSGTDFWSADLVLVTAGATTEDIDFAVMEGGVITGTVRDGNGVGVSDVYVAAHSYNQHQAISSTYTDETGAYTISGLPDGNYRMRSSWYGYEDIWYPNSNNWDESQVISVVPGTPTTIDFDYPGPGSISGVVTDTDAAPIVGADVSVWSIRTYMNAGVSTTDEFGEYELIDLPPGDYAVSFKADGFAPELWDNRPGPFYSAYGNLELVVVTSGVAVTGIDPVLEPAGSITGLVTDASTGDPVVGLQVEIEGTTSGWSGQINTDEVGRYAIPGVFPDDYIVTFSGWETPYVTSWYDGQSSRADATPVTVAPGAVATADTSLTAGGTITGSVTAGGSPVNDVVAGATDVRSGLLAAYTRTDATGSYQIEGLPTGEYEIRIGTPLSIPYLANPSVIDEPTFSITAPTVAVALGQSVAVAEIQLDPSGSISGQIIDGSGAPVRGAEVMLRWLNDPDRVQWASTTPTGSYRFENLPSTNYAVSASAPMTGETVFYEAASDLAGAIPVPVAGGAETSGIDIVLPDSSMGRIEGTVTRDGGIPFVRAEVQAEDGTGRTWMREAGYDGTYSLNVPVGSYTVVFYPATTWAGDNSVFLSEWYDDQANPQGATEVVVAAGSATAGIDADLGRGGAISGVVTAAGGAPLAGATVRINVPNEGWVETTTAPDGTYTLSRVRAGTHSVQFTHPSYVNEWFGDVLREADASQVVVTDGVVTASVDVELAVGGTITGTLTDSIDSVYPIEVYTIDGTLIAWGFHDGVGPYEVNGVPEGTVYVRLHSWSETSIGQWYGGDSSEWWAESNPSQGYGTPVEVTTGATTSGINFAPIAPSSISGTITDATTGLPVGDVDACASIQGVGETPYSTICTEVQWWEGEYTINVGPGTYTLRFEDWNYVRAKEWWDSASDEASATTIMVGDGESLVGYDAALIRPGGIGGSAIDASSSPINAALVEVFEPQDTDNPVGFMYTDPDGAYAFGDLLPGEYVLRLSDPDGLFETRWYDRWSAAMTADTVTVGSDALTTGVDFSYVDHPRDETTVEVVLPSEDPTTVTTADPEGGGEATEADPIVTTVIVPPSETEGVITFTEIPLEEMPPEEIPTVTDFVLFGSVIVIDTTLPELTDETFYEIILRLDASVVPSGEDENTITVFRDGVAVGECTSPGVHSSDPCMSERVPLDGGDLEFTILSAHFSDWYFASEEQPSVKLRSLSLAPTGPVAINIPVALTVDMTVEETTTVQVDWGDGSVEPFDGEAARHQPFVHAYGDADVYTIDVQLLDGEDVLDQDTYEYVAVYDPAGGFVTGGGWVGAASDDASFGLVVRYDRKGNPKGNIEFHSSSEALSATEIDWLVIAPDDEVYIQGIGVFDGRSGHPYRIDLYDGDRFGRADTFRLQVWEPGSETLTDAPFVVGGVLGGGKVQVHRK